MSTLAATNNASPELIAEVRRHAEGWLPGGIERFAHMLSLHPMARHAGPTAMAELVAEEVERLGGSYRDADSPEPSSKSALKRYITALEADGTLMPGAATRLYAAVAVDQVGQPLAKQVRAVRDLLARPEANTYLSVSRRHGAPKDQQKMHKLLARHFPAEVPAAQRDAVAVLHGDIVRMGMNEEKAVATLAFRFHLPASDGRHNPRALAGGRISYGPNGAQVEPAWAPPPLTPAAEAEFAKLDWTASG